MDKKKTGSPIVLPKLDVPTSNTVLSTSRRPQANPGKRASVAGIVFAFIGLQLIGLALSIWGISKSKKAGASKLLGGIGIGLNIVTLAVMSAALVYFFVAMQAGSRTDALKEPVGIGPATLTADGKTAAQEIVDRTNHYHSMHGFYPLLLSDYEKNTTTSLKQLDRIIIAQQALADTHGYTTERTGRKSIVTRHIELYACGATAGNKIGYWDATSHKAAYLFTGGANRDTNCVMMK